MTSYAALTLWQPWATLVAEKLKPYEFRSWEAPRRFWGQRIAIHAGAKAVKRADLQEMLLQLRRDGRRAGHLKVEGAIELIERALTSPGILPRSAVVCIATLGQPLDPNRVAREMGNDSDRGQHFNYAWPLTDIEPLQPVVPAKGALGFWRWEAADA